MTIITVFDRELPLRLKALLALQRPAPLHIRLVSQHLLNFKIDNKSIFQILRMLKTKKSANITILLDKKIYKNDTPIAVKEEIEKLVEIGINFHTINNLHAKLITVENNKEQCLLITSANLSNNAYYKTHEAGLYMENHDEKIFKSFKHYITQLISAQNQ